MDDVQQTPSMWKYFLYKLSSAIHLFYVCGTSHDYTVMMLFCVVPQHTPVVNGYTVNYSVYFPSVLNHCMLVSLVKFSTHSPLLITLLQ